MPIYDHLCDHCGHAFSVVRSFKDPPVEHCPKCGKRPRRLIAPPAIVFKGSGWYKTDSRASSTATKDKSAAPEGSGSSEGDTKKSEAGTPAKADDKPSAASREAAS